jgi:hypothetical protein
MKKLLFATCFAVLTLSISSCGSSTSGGASSYQFTITNSDWIASGTQGTSNYLYYVNHTMTEITSSIASNGMVMAYVQLGSDWGAMPYIETYSTYTVTYGYQYQPNLMRITRKDSDLNTLAPSGNIVIKVVIVNPKSMGLLDGVNTNDYLEVKQALHLAD